MYWGITFHKVNKQVALVTDLRRVTKWSKGISRNEINPVCLKKWKVFPQEKENQIFFNQNKPYISYHELWKNHKKLEKLTSEQTSSNPGAQILKIKSS